jgi:hypothetical protein
LNLVLSPIGVMVQPVPSFSTVTYIKITN